MNENTRSSNPGNLLKFADQEKLAKAREILRAVIPDLPAEIIARAFMRLQCADVPREPWQLEVCQILQTPQVETSPVVPPEYRERVRDVIRQGLAAYGKPRGTKSGAEADAWLRQLADQGPALKVNNDASDSSSKERSNIPETIQEHFDKLDQLEAHAGETTGMPDRWRRRLLSLAGDITVARMAFNEGSSAYRMLSLSLDSIGEWLVEKPSAAETSAVAVAGDSLPTSLADFEHRATHWLGEEQARANPNNALIALLCDAVRLARENERLARAPLKANDIDMVMWEEMKEAIVKSPHFKEMFEAGGMLNDAVSNVVSMLLGPLPYVHLNKGGRLRTLRKTVEHYARTEHGRASGETVRELTEAAAVLQALEDGASDETSEPANKFTGQREGFCTHCGNSAWSHACPSTTAVKANVERGSSHGETGES